MGIWVAGYLIQRNIEQLRAQQKAAAEARWRWRLGHAQPPLTPHAPAAQAERAAAEATRLARVRKLTGARAGPAPALRAAFAPAAVALTWRHAAPLLRAPADGRGASVQPPRGE